MDKNKERLIIYQLFPRIFTNTNANCVPWGTLEQNGSGKFKDYTPRLLRHIKELGINCLWFTGVIEHATKTDFSRFGIEPDNPNVVKGEAGSPYAIKDYYDVDPALAVDVRRRMGEFEDMVRRIHRENLKILIDFVPNHTARVYHSDRSPAGVEDFGVRDDISMNFSPKNNYYYISNQQFMPSISLSNEGDKPYVEFPAKATGNDCFTAFCTKNDWYETVKLNYGHDYACNCDHFDPVPDTWNKMVEILKFWAGQGVDGFRCDMVFMVPLAFWHWAIPKVKAVYPHVIFIGEIYDIGLYRPFLHYGCFDYLYDKVNLYDTLVGIETNGWSAAQLTGCWQTVDGIGDRMLNFLENHDEVRFGSRAYAGDSLRIIPSLIISTMISKGPIMIYYGQELGEPAHDNEGFAGDNDRTTIFDYWSVSTLRRWYNGGKCDETLLSAHERWLRNVYRTVLTLCNERPALREGAFFDLMYVNLRQQGFNPHSNFAFLRYHGDDILLIVVNFDREASQVSVFIPSVAFEVSGLEERELVTEDLLWGKAQKLNLKANDTVTLFMSAADALVLPIGKLGSGEQRKMSGSALRGEKKTDTKGGNSKK